MYLSRDNLFVWLDGMKPDFEVFVPVVRGRQREYQRYSAPRDDIVVGGVRVTDPLKGFFTPAREKVAVDFDVEIPPRQNKPAAIVGVKACDLHGFEIQDRVFLNQDCEDPFYLRARRDNLIIAADCTHILDSCFCLSLGHQPYPEELFDINLAEVEDGYIVETGSDKGRQITEQFATLFETVSPAHVEQRIEQRRQVVAELERSIEAHGVPHKDQFDGMIERNYEAELWQDEARTCVECGACNTVCPTCHCFKLSDQRSGQQMVRYRHWDACLVKDFAQVAGGGNPRPELWMRLRNRFEKKFDFFPKTTGLTACTGCGRCITACPAKIDIRTVLRRLAADD